MKGKTIATAAAVVLALALGGAAYYIHQQQQTIDALAETFQLEKEQLEDEYTQLAIQYEGYQIAVNNDSLEQKLEDQRIKIQRLVEELRQTKAQDARRIAQLKQELETVRGALRYYVAQVDSLNRINESLMVENRQQREQIQQANRNNATLARQNQQLTEKVSLAAQLTTAGMRAVALNKREKETDRLKTTVAFRLDFTIAANVTAAIGEKSVYLRILKPNDDLLTNARSGQFDYDGARIGYSTRKVIEFGGQETPVTLYWSRGETLDAGTFTFEVYADGNMIGSTTLTMKN